MSTGTVVDLDLDDRLAGQLRRLARDEPALEHKQCDVTPLIFHEYVRLKDAEKAISRTQGPALMNIVETIQDPKLFGPWFPGDTWNRLVILKAAFALPMTPEEVAFFFTIAHRAPPLLALGSLSPASPTSSPCLPIGINACVPAPARRALPSTVDRPASCWITLAPISSSWKCCAVWRRSKPTLVWDLRRW